MNSLQYRLIVGGAGVFAVGFLIAGIAVYGFSRQTMQSEFDQSLRATVQALAALATETEDGVHFELIEGFEEFTRIDQPSYFQVWLDGEVLTRSPRLDTRDLSFGFGSFLRPDYTAVVLPDGRLGRQASITFRPKFGDRDGGEEWEDLDWNDDDDDDGQYFSTSGMGFTSFDSETESETPPGKQLKGADATLLVMSSPESTTSPSAADSGIFTLTWERPERRVTIAVARANNEIERRLANLRWILSSVGVAITVISSCMLVWVVRQGLKPVEAVTRAITEIDEHSLDDRVPSDRVPSEIAPMVSRLNDLLGRMEEAFHRERAFSSNLAHELRTPLAGLKSTLEVYLSRTHKPHEYEQALSTCLLICDQSQNLVENLLALAGVEGRQLRRQYEAFDVEELVTECWAPLADAAADKDLQVQFDMSREIIRSDREMLRMIVRNVLSNAVCYSNCSGSVFISLSEDEMLSIRVSNTGHGLTPEQATRVFDRLWRGDQARGQTGEHFGLGLTLTKRLAEALGGAVHVTVDEMFHMSITLPRDS